jgi:hypothetical protein
MEVDGPNVKGLQGRLDACMQELGEISSQIAAAPPLVSAGTDGEGRSEFYPSLKEMSQDTTAFRGSNSKQRHQNEFNVSRLALQRSMASVVPSSSLASSAKVYDESEVFKTRHNNLLRRKHELEVLAEELRASLRRIKSASMLKCAPSDVVEVVFRFSPEKLAHVVGKGFMGLRQIESKCRVIIETDKTTGSVVVIGAQEAVIFASSEINAITDKYYEEIFLSDEKIVCLFLDKAQLLQCIQCQHGVRIDISRARGSCKMYGSFDGVKAAVDAMRSIQGKRAEAYYSEEMTGFFLGHGDGMLREIEARRGVQIELQRESFRLVVVGPDSEVDAAIEDVNEILRDFVEAEEAITVARRFVINSILGNGGFNARRLQRELGVTLSAEGLEDETAEQLQLIMRGPRQKVSAAKSELQYMHQSYVDQNLELRIPDSVVAVVVGKKGSRIQALRSKYPEATIELDNGLLHVKCSNAEYRLAIKDYIETLVLENFTKTFSANADVLAVIKTSSRGKALRESFREQKVNCDLDAEDGIIVLRGVQDNVERAFAELEKFEECNHSEIIQLDNEDRIFIQVPVDVDDSIQDILESEFNVELSVNRKDNTVTIIGRQENVMEARGVMREYLVGSEMRGTAILQMAPFVVPFLIGKEGANSKKFEKENNVKLNFNTVKNTVRIRLNPSVVSSLPKDIVARMLRKAKSAVQAEARLAPVSKVLTVEARHVNKTGIDPQMWSAVVMIADQREVSIANAFKNKVCVSGPCGRVDEACADIQALLCGENRYLIRANEMHVRKLGGEHKQVVEQFRGQHPRVVATILPEGIELCGRVADIIEARKEVYELLYNLFPGQFAKFSVDRGAVEGFGDFRMRYEIEDELSVLIDLDRDCSCLRICGSEQQVRQALVRLEEEKSERIGRVEFIEVENCLSRELTQLYESVLQDFESEMQVKIRVKPGQVQIEGPDKLTTFIARSRIEEWLEGLPRGVGCFEVQIPAVSVGAFIGKGGANIRQLRNESGATIEFSSELGTATVSGTPEFVSLAREMIDAFLVSETCKRYALAVSVPAQSQARFAGRVPKYISEYCSHLQVKLELDRVKCEFTLRGRCSLLCFF